MLLLLLLLLLIASHPIASNTLRANNANALARGKFRGEAYNCPERQERQGSRSRDTHTPSTTFLHACC